MPAFDAIVIGTGQAGPSLAHRLAGAGSASPSSSGKQFGGTCVNTGCTPDQDAGGERLRRAPGPPRRRFGVTIGGAVSVDMKKVKARKDACLGVSRARRRALAQSNPRHHRLPGPRALRSRPAACRSATRR